MSDQVPATPPAQSSSSASTDILMQNSPTLGKIFSALAAAQGEMKDAVLDMENPHYKSKYASLKSVKNACQVALAKHKLSVNYQIFSVKDVYCMRTILGHESGEWMSTTFRLLIDKNNMQGLGSAITYGKRYSLAAMVGVVDSEDDDGNSAAGKPAPPQERKPNPAKPAAAAQPKQAPNTAPASRQMIDQINSLCIDRNINETILLALIKEYGFPIGKVPVWVVNEVGQILEKEDCKDTTLLAHAEIVRKRRAEKEGAK